MSSPFDRLLKRCIRTFSLKTVYISGGIETPVKGIFDQDYFAVAMDNGPITSSKEIKIHYHVNDLPGKPKRGDEIRINDRFYTVSESQPDSEFGITLILKLAD